MQQVADKMNFQDPVQKYAECHSWDMSKSNATKYHEIKLGILDNTCFKENVPTFEILVGWILRLGLNFWVINVALYGWKCDPAFHKTAENRNFLRSFSALSHTMYYQFVDFARYQVLLKTAENHTSCMFW